MIASVPSGDRYLYQRHLPPASESQPDNHHQYHNHQSYQYSPAAYTSAPELGASKLDASISAAVAATTSSPQRTVLTCSASFPSFASSSPSSSFSSSNASTCPSISPTLRRKPSYTKRSLKATHRITIRRIISASHSQQQQQDPPVLNHNHNHHNHYYHQHQHQHQYQPQQSANECQLNIGGIAPSGTLSPSSSYPDIVQRAHQSSPGPSISRRGLVTEAVFGDHHPCLTISPSSQGAKAHDCCLRCPRSPSLSTPPCIPRLNASIDPALPLSVSLVSPTSSSFLNRSAPLSATASISSSCSSSASSSSSSSTSSTYFSFSSLTSTPTLTSTSSRSHYPPTSFPPPLSQCTPSSKLASPSPLDRSCDSFHGQDALRRQPLSSITSTAELQASVAAQGRACRPAYQEQHLQQQHTNQKRTAPFHRMHTPPRMSSLPLPDPCCSCTLPSSDRREDRPPASASASAQHRPIVLADKAVVVSPLSARHEHELFHSHHRPDRTTTATARADQCPHTSQTRLHPLSSSLSAPSLLSSTTHSLVHPLPLADKRTLSASASWTMPSQSQVVLREILSSQSRVRHTLHPDKGHSFKSLLPTGSRPRPLKSRKVGDESHPLPRRRSTLRRKDSSSYNRSSELLRTRRQTTPKLARYLDMKPLPLVRSVSGKKSQGVAEPRLEKPLPPIPRTCGDLHWDIGIGEKTCIDIHAADKEGVDDKHPPGKQCLQLDDSPLFVDTSNQGRYRLSDKQDLNELETTTHLPELRNLPGKDQIEEDSHQQQDMSTDRGNNHSAVQCNELQTQQVAPSVTIDGLLDQPQGTPTEEDKPDGTSLKRLDSFRFPMSKSPTERRIPARPKIRHHHHQSMPVNMVRSRLPFRVMNGPSPSLLDAVHHTRRSSTATSVSTTSDREFVTSDIIKALTGQTEKSKSVPDCNKWSLRVDQEKRKDRGSSSTSSSAVERPHYRGGRLRRSESCSSSTLAHRPSLSFNSSKKALLSLQSRRINKPDAKVHRLPEIQTTSVPTRSLVFVENTAIADCSTSVAQSHTSSNDIANTESAEMNAAKLENNRSTSAVLQQEETSPSDMTDYQLQVSEKDRLAIDTILKELATPDSFKSAASDPMLSASAMLLTRTCGAPVITQDDSPLLPQQDAKMSPTSNNTGTGTAPDHGSGSDLPSAFHSSLVIDPRSIMETGESKRFVKRSHALRELVSTEKSYVEDLDTLVNVHLRLLRTKSWFPRTTHNSLLKCTNGLLFTHRRFLSVLDGNLITGADRDRVPLSVYQTLAESFKIMCEDRELYDDFCEQRMRAVKTVNRYEGTTTLLTLQRESKDMMIQQGRPNVRVDLKDLLIKPIQRICRYPLLLKEVLRLTSLEDPEYSSVEESHRRMKDRAQDLDGTQKKVERKLLTEQFLKKLDETNLPKKYVFTPFVVGNAASVIVDPPNSHNSRNSYNGNNHGVHPPQAPGDQHATGSLHSPAGTSYNEYFDHGLGAEGVVPSPLTRDFVGSLGSILLAGALEFVLIPEIPIRLKYYGCFLFETMLIVVKPRKASQYEPRQWLPLRLCELQETTRLDGYTRHGWSLLFDQFRMDFGASGEEEQEIWMRSLRVQIQAAKDAYARLPIGLAAFQTLTSSLPWRMTKAQARSVLSARQLQQQHLILSPSIATSPWSTNSSAFSSPPLSSVSFSFVPSGSMTPSMENEKCKGRGFGHEGTVDDSYEAKEARSISHSISEACQQTGTRLSAAMADNSNHRVGGMAVAGDHCQGMDTLSHQSPSRTASQYFRPHHSSHLQYHQQQHPHQQQQLPSAHLLPPGSPAPWLFSENRSRTHSFDVARVFTSSSHGGSIKPNQRTLVQNMFKDISAENFWTTSSAHPGTPTPQGGNSTPMPYSPCQSSASLISPFPSVSSSSRLASNTSSPSQSGVIFSGMARSTMTVEGESDTAGTPLLRSAGSSSASLTSRILRRRDSGTRQSPNGAGIVPPERSDWDRRRNSATAAIAATLALNFRKNAEPQPSFQHLRRSSLHNEPLFAGSSDHPLQEAQDGLYQRISVKARAQLFERRASSFHNSNSNINTTPISSSPLSSKPRTGSEHKIKTSQSHQDISSLQMTPTVRRSTSIQQQQTNADTLQTLSNAAEAAQSRRGTLRRSVHLGGASSPSSSFHAPALVGATARGPSLPSKASSDFESNRTRTPTGTAESGDNNIEKIWTAMGRLTHMGKSQSSSRLSSMGQSSQSLHPLHLAADSPVSSQNSMANDHSQPQHSWDTVTPLSTPHSSRATPWRRESSRSAAPRRTVSSPSLDSSHMLVPTPYSPAVHVATFNATTSDSCAGSDGSSSVVASTVSATHSRSFSVSSSQSTNSDSSSDFVRPGQMTGQQLFFASSPSSSPGGSASGPRLTLTPSVSVMSCTSTSSTDASSIYSNTLSIMDQPHSLAHMNDYPASSTPAQPQSSDLYHPELLPIERSKLPSLSTNTNGNSVSPFQSPTTVVDSVAKSTIGGSPFMASPTATTTTSKTTLTTGVHERRKSLSVLQTFTHSASQKFKTMMRSPNGIRRRSIMSLSPMTLEHSPALISNLSSTTPVRENGDGEDAAEYEEEK